MLGFLTSPVSIHRRNQRSAGTPHKDTHLKENTVGLQETETSGRNIAERSIELASQRWNRAKSVARAKNEDIDLNDEHWAVIVFMRKHYREHGLPINARTTARALNRHFSGQGGSKYLRGLFNGGPVAQGSRIANLRTPAYATDPSFGTSY
jgi:tRNA 2-thiouridine synthesizing protein E